MNARDATRVADIIEAIGTHRLGVALDQALAPSVEFEMSCIFVFRFNTTPILLHNGYGDSVPQKTLTSYMQGGYLLDPYYIACTKNHPAGLWRMTELAPDSFFASDFSVSKDIHPCVSSSYGADIEEIGYIFPLESQAALVYSLMRNKSVRCFEPLEIAALDTLMPVVKCALETHYRLTLAESQASVPTDAADIEDTFLELLSEPLTDSQRYVAKYLLQGHSNTAIAEALGISEGTVRLHKHNLYQRLSISSHAELFKRFIDYLTRQSNALDVRL